MTDAFVLELNITAEFVTTRRSVLLSTYDFDREEVSSSKVLQMQRPRRVEFLSKPMSFVEEVLAPTQIAREEPLLFAIRSLKLEKWRLLLFNARDELPSKIALRVKRAVFLLGRSAQLALNATEEIPTFLEKPIAPEFLVVAKTMVLLPRKEALAPALLFRPH